MLDPVTGLDPEIQRMIERAEADSLCSMGVDKAVAESMAAAAGIAYRVTMERGRPPPNYYRAYGAPPMRSAKTRSKKSQLATALKHAAKNNMEMTRTPDGTMKFRPVSTANDVPSEPSDAWDEALGLKQ